MRGANITAAVAVILWAGWAFIGRSLVAGVVNQEAIGYPNMGQIDTYIVIPLLVVSALLICAWICNALEHGAGALALLSGAAVVALLPYLALTGGGV